MLISQAPILLVVLVGIPGSGKSTFAKSLIDGDASGGRKWARISQDVLGTRQKCVRAANRALECGEHILVDRCNFDEQQRSHWLGLERPPKRQQHKIAVYLPLPLQTAQQRVLKRGIHEGGVDTAIMSESKILGIVRRMHSSLRPPELEEGFDELLVVGDEQQRLEALERLWAAASAGSVDRM